MALQDVRDQYDTALALLDEFVERLAFPVQRFRWHAARAILAANVGDNTSAAAHARTALEAAEAERSDFAFHRELGLVGDRFLPYQIQVRHLERLGERGMFLPCPPVTRGEEVSAEAMLSPRCQNHAAKDNLLHVQNAILEALAAALTCA